MLEAWDRAHRCLIATGKGEVERSHGTNQDRLIKKLRLKGISTHGEVNEYLEQIYLPAHNAQKR